MAVIYRSILSEVVFDRFEKYQAACLWVFLSEFSCRHRMTDAFTCTFCNSMLNFYLDNVRILALLWFSSQFILFERDIPPWQQHQRHLHLRSRSFWISQLVSSSRWRLWRRSLRLGRDHWVIFATTQLIMLSLSKHLLCLASLMMSVFKELALRVLWTVWWGQRRQVMCLELISSWMKKSSYQVPHWIRSRSCTMPVITFAFHLKLHLAIGSSPSCPELWPRTVWRFIRFLKPKSDGPTPWTSQASQDCSEPVAYRWRRRTSPDRFSWIYGAVVDLLDCLEYCWHREDSITTDQSREFVTVALSMCWFPWTSCSSTGRERKNFAKAYQSPTASTSSNTLTGQREQSGLSVLQTKKIPSAASSPKSTRKGTHTGLRRPLWQLYRLQHVHLQWQLHMELLVQQHQEERWPNLWEMGNRCARTGRTTGAQISRRDPALTESISVHTLSQVEFALIQAILVASVTTGNAVEIFWEAVHLPVSLHVRHLPARQMIRSLFNSKLTLLFCSMHGIVSTLRCILMTTSQTHLCFSICWVVRITPWHKLLPGQVGELCSLLTWRLIPNSTSTTVAFVKSVTFVQ